MRKILGVATAVILGVGIATTAGADETRLEESEVAWLHNGCETLIEEGNVPAAGSEIIDYWGPVCHGYAIAARDYVNLLVGSVQSQQQMRVQGCFAEGETVTGRQVARAFVEYVERHPASQWQSAPSVMFEAVTQRWCPKLLAPVPENPR